jgi:hypothetical protein
MTKRKNKQIHNDVLNRLLDDAWLNIHIDPNHLYNPLEPFPEEFIEEPHLYLLWLMRQPEYFSLICSEILNVHLLPFQVVILNELWEKKFPMLIATRGGGKTFILAVYALLRLLLIPGRKIVICGAAYRQSRLIHDYMTTIWNNAPLLRDLCDTNSGPKRDIDMCRFHINDSLAVALPIGNGETIRGQRANDILADEFAAINREVFETVISGFGSVRSRPDEVVRQRAKIKKAKELGVDLDSSEISEISRENQVIVSGTAYYSFNHFAEYFKTYKNIISSKGDKDKLIDIFKDEEQIKTWDKYSIIRIPVESLPDGFMDEGMVARARATHHSGTYEMEYGAVFSSDSNGFFKRTLIESCVAMAERQIFWDNTLITFEPRLYANPNRKYIISIDPASESDNFAICVLELHPNHRRVVYVWTVTKKEHRRLLADRDIKETDFYTFCAFKIRDLMKKFPAERVVIDAGGGGIAVCESLHDEYRIPLGESPIWPIIDPQNPQVTDGKAGLHIIEMVNFSKHEWVREANHGLKKDFENKKCLLPYFDPLSLGLAELQDGLESRRFDTLEDCVAEIEEMKNELSSIVVSQTPSGKERWDTPEIKEGAVKKGRMRKDRYTALLMANMSARVMEMDDSVPIGTYSTPGGFAAYSKDTSGVEYIGPDWFVSRMRGVYD